MQSPFKGKLPVFLAQSGNLPRASVYVIAMTGYGIYRSNRIPCVRFLPYFATRRVFKIVGFLEEEWSILLQSNAIRDTIVKYMRKKSL